MIAFSIDFAAAMGRPFSIDVLGLGGSHVILNLKMEMEALHLYARQRALFSGVDLQVWSTGHHRTELGLRSTPKGGGKISPSKSLYGTPSVAKP